MVKKRKQAKSEGPAKPSKKKYKNLLAMRPVRKCKWEFEGEDKAKVVIFFPRFQSRLGKKIGESYGLVMDRKLHLDDYGSSVWRLCDGKTTVREIGDVLEEQYGDSISPLYPRLAEFFSILERNKFIEFKELKSVKKKPE
jgi:hypothetical protein